MTVKRKMQKIESSFFTVREQTIDGFHKEFFSWSAGNIGMWIVAGFFEFFLGVFLWIPYQGMQEMEMLGIVAFLAMWGTMSYISPYLQFQEGGKSTRLYEKLQYLPTSLEELQKYRLKKLAIFCLKMFLIFLAGQLFFSLVVYHEITLENILYVAMGGFIIPFTVSALIVKCSK